MVGIVSYGTYIPRYRIKLSDIANAWKKESYDVIESLGLTEKAVPAADEDAVTIALEAARAALIRQREASDKKFLTSQVPLGWFSGAHQLRTRRPAWGPRAECRAGCRLGASIPPPGSPWPRCCGPRWPRW